MLGLWPSFPLFRTSVPSCVSTPIYLRRFGAIGTVLCGSFADASACLRGTPAVPTAGCLHTSWTLETPPTEACESSRGRVPELARYTDGCGTLPKPVSSFRTMIRCVRALPVQYFQGLSNTPQLCTVLCVRTWGCVPRSSRRASVRYAGHIHIPPQRMTQLLQYALEPCSCMIQHPCIVCPSGVGDGNGAYFDAVPLLDPGLMKDGHRNCQSPSENHGCCRTALAQSDTTCYGSVAQAACSKGTWPRRISRKYAMATGSGVSRRLIDARTAERHTPSRKIGRNLSEPQVSPIPVPRFCQEARRCNELPACVSALEPHMRWMKDGVVPV